jgi:hypothetical protein
MISTVRFGDNALMIAPTPNRTSPAVRQRVRPYLSVSFPPGIINAAGDLHALHRGVQVGADVVDHHVHAGTGVAAQELRQRQWQQNCPCRG